MKAYFDDRHKLPPALQVGDFVYIKLAKKSNSGYHLNNQSKLSHRRVGPFQVKKCINALRSEIDLPYYLKWNPEISIEHLEPVYPGTREGEPPGPLIQASSTDNDKYIIEQVAGSLLLVFFISAAGAMGGKVWQVDLCASLRD